MADGRTFTEGEAYALVEDAVTRETAAAKSQITELESGKTTLQNRIDVLETEKAAEVQRADAAEKALADYKGEIEQEKAREARRAERVKQVAEASPLLEITDERSDRIVAMTEEVFEGYLADLREVASKAPKGDKDDKGKPKGKSDIPRESAAFHGSSDTDTEPQKPVTTLIGARRNLGA